MLRFSKSLAFVFFAALLLVLAAFSVSADLIGGDVSEPVSGSQFQCLKDSHGWGGVVVRAYCSYGGVDSNARATLLNAAQAGITERGIYVFPCYGKSADSIASETLANTPLSMYSMVYLDIESNPSPGCGWGGNGCQYLGELIDAFRSRGAKVGIYSSVYEWSITVGDSCTIGAQKGVPVWYARYDGSSSISGGWLPFGGYSLANVIGRQWSDSIGGACGVSADADVWGSAGPSPPSPPSPPSGGCMSFYEGLCNGGSNCMCTLGETCGGAKNCVRNFTKARNANGGCSGSCMNVVHGECPGNAYCLKASGYC